MQSSYRIFQLRMHRLIQLALMYFFLFKNISFAVDYQIIDRQITHNQFAPQYFIEPSLDLDLYIEDLSKQEKKEIILQALKDEAQSHSKIRINIYTLREQTTDSEKELLKVATASYGYSGCYHSPENCFNEKKYEIQFLTNQDKSSLEIWDKHIANYKALIIFVTPPIIIFILSRRRQKNRPAPNSQVKK